MTLNKFSKIHHLISKALLPRVSKPLMPSLSQQQIRYLALSMVFPQRSSGQGKFSRSSEAIPNQRSNIKNLLPGLSMAHVSNYNQRNLNIQNSATELNNSNYPQLTSSHLQPSSQVLEAIASAQQLNPTELETLVQEVYRRLLHQLKLDRERLGFYSGRLPW